MSDETWPAALVPHAYDIYLQPNTGIQESPVTRKRRFLAHVGQRWVYTMSLRLTRPLSQQMDALLDRLKGPQRTVALWDMDRESPLGPNLDRSSLARTRFADSTQFADGTRFSGGAAGVRVHGAWPRGAETVLADGFPQNTTQLLAGDGVEINARLYRLTADAAADGLGRAYLALNRPLLAAAAHRTLIGRSRPSSPFRLVDDDQARRKRQVGSLNLYDLAFVEDPI